MSDLESKEQIDPTIFSSDAVANPPVFPGGEREMEAFFEKSVQYPQEAYENFVTGEVVVSFVVNDLGEISNPTIVKGLGYGCDDEVLRVVKLMPNWQPASNEGQKVWTAYEVPVNFSLEFDLGEEEASSGVK